ncbi:MAG: long-chain fatty acid--CoA ligase [Myxococcales bacterium]|nr:long-chain fatty acid--CoA ligase [Myxococcales bacterium]
MLETAPHVPCAYLAGESRTLGDMFKRRVARSGEYAAFFHKVDGHWQPTSWKRWHDRAVRVAAGLARRGLAPGDRVAVLGPTRPEWALYEMGAQLAGCVSLGVYPKQSVEQVQYVLAHSDARVVFVDEAHELDTVLAAADGCPALEAIVPWDPALLDGRNDQRLLPPALFTEPSDGSEIEARLAARDPDDAAIFVYTSGTTGPPKCAMITHRNVLTLLSHQATFLDFFEDDLSLSFLPMAHVAERVLAFYGRIGAGFSTAYATSNGAVLEELREVQPTIFGSVPRLFEKAYSKIQSEVERKPPAVRKLFAWAQSVGRQRLHLQMAGRRVPLPLKVQYALADRLVFAKIRGAFGGRVRQFVVGAAPTPLEVLEFFWSVGLPIYEVYGQTEATVVSHANGPGNVRLGTVGRIIPDLEQRIADDGELLLRGPTVFAGYFKNPEATAETVVDGWLHTGDVVTLDADGFLRITDRKKHIIITAGGKNLTPANIEKAIKAADPLISHVHAHADKRPYVAALVVPSPLETLDFGRDRGLVTDAELRARTAELMENPAGRTEALAAAMAPVTRHPEFVARMRAAVRKGNEALAQVEKVKRFLLLDRDFSQEGGELTPTMKVKRKAVERDYAEVFDRIYAEAGFALEP